MGQQLKMPYSRLPRFERSPGIRNFQLMPRDFEVLKALETHQYLTSSQIASLCGGSGQTTRRRLQTLFHHGYISRPRAQLEYYHQGGSKEMIYGMDAEGSRLLAGFKDRRFQKTMVGRMYLNHAISVSKVMVALELACRRSRLARISYLTRHPTIPGRSMRWKVQVNPDTCLHVIPDKSFSLDFAAADKPSSNTFFLEVDLGTMPVERGTLAQTSVYRKLLAYQASWEQSVCHREFGLRRFRVMILTPGKARLQRIADVCRTLKSGHGLFLLSDLESFSDAPNPLSFKFTTGAGHPAKLLD